jgi:SAM-dependent methyltransferase
VSAGIDEQRAYYDRRWGEPLAASPFELRRAVTILRLLARTGAERPRILDLGCGRGWLAGILQAFGPTTGVDLSEAGIAAARGRWPEVDFRAGDLFAMPLERGAFDVVVSQEVIEHVEDQARYLAIAADCLREGGHLVLTTPNRRVVDRFSRRDREAWGVQPLEKLLDGKELRRLLDVRFEVVEQGTILPGVGSRGVLLLLNSRRLRRLLGPGFDAFRCRIGFGLHLYALARLRANRAM